MDFRNEPEAPEIPSIADVEPEHDVEASSPEPMSFRFDHADSDAVLTIAVRGGREVVLESGEEYSTADRYEIRGLEAHQQVERVSP